MSKKEELSEQYRRKAYEVSPTRKRCQHNNEVIAWNNEIVGAFESGWDAACEDADGVKGHIKLWKEEFLDKACEFLETYPHMFMGILRSEMIDDFRKAMGD